MQFFTKLAAIAAAAAVAVSATNTVTFVNQDSTTRTVIFTPSENYPSIDSIKVSGMESKNVSIPESWVGNWYSVCEGSDETTGMLGEVTFQGWGGINYFDVSAIVNPNDKDGVHQIYPASELDAEIKSLFSGCSVFPCNTAYYVWNDLQTMSTTENELICTLGNSNSTSESSKRDAHSLFERKFVEGKF